MRIFNKLFKSAILNPVFQFFAIVFLKLFLLKIRRKKYLSKYFFANWKIMLMFKNS